MIISFDVIILMQIYRIEVYDQNNQHGNITNRDIFNLCLYFNSI